MNMIKDFRNNLLKRKELLFSVEAASNPGFQKMLEQCASYFKVEADKVVVKKVWSNFESREFFIEAFIYDSVKDKEKTEPKLKPKKEKGVVK